MLPTLHTDRLTLRLPCLEDLDGIHQLGSNPRVMQYITNGRTQSREQAREDLMRRIKQSQGPMGYWIVTLRERGDLLGWVALKPLENSPYIELGYRLQEAYWGRGFATEAGRALLEYGFGTLQLPEIWAVALPENLASTRVMEKLGMSYSGAGRYYGADCVCYQIKFEVFQRQKRERLSLDG